MYVFLHSAKKALAVSSWMFLDSYQGSLVYDFSPSFALLSAIWATQQDIEGRSRGIGDLVKPGMKAFEVLARPSAYRFTGSTISNSLCLWLVNNTFMGLRRAYSMQLIRLSSWCQFKLQEIYNDICWTVFMKLQK